MKWLEDYISHVKSVCNERSLTMKWEEDQEEASLFVSAILEGCVCHRSGSSWF